jgi:hypothetical protein
VERTIAGTLLAPDGSLFLVVSSPAIYVNEWASFSTRDFPENRHARDGDRVRIVMLDVPDRRPVEDVVCTDARYRRLFESAGLGVLDVQSPLATGKEATRWISETSTAPWTIYVLSRLPGDEANSESIREQAGPIAKRVQRACYDTLPWLISFSLGVSLKACWLPEPKLHF